VQLSGASICLMSDGGEKTLSEGLGRPSKREGRVANLFGSSAESKRP